MSETWPPINMQDVRLVAGEGKLPAWAVLDACNTIVRQRLATPPSEIGMFERVSAAQLARYFKVTETCAQQAIDDFGFLYRQPALRAVVGDNK